MDAKTRRIARVRRHARVRKKVAGTAERPRLAVYRSNRHIYAQLIDDHAAATLAAASDAEIDAGGADDGGADDGARGKTDRAKAVGKLIADRAKGAGIDRVVFDRGGRRFHGRVAAVAEGAREGGLQI
jgi:large subunit ribosomal protein L18